VVAHSSSRIDFISRRYFFADILKTVVTSLTNHSNLHRVEREFLDDVLEPLHLADPILLPPGHPSH
jgi:hypothetical protein